MTLDKLARMTANEFFAVRKEMNDGFESVKKDVTGYVDARLIDYKDDIREIVRDENKIVIKSNDEVVTKLDILVKEEVARTEQYKRQEKDILRQEKDISMLKQKVGV